MIALVGCGVDVEIPVVDIGYDYDCTVTMGCDGETIVEHVWLCGSTDGQEVTNEVWERCVDAAQAGCAAWSCATQCSGVGYCAR